MQETKLTIRLPRKLLENAKRYARRQNTTLTQLIKEYLYHIPTPIDALEDGPIIRKLSGTLSKDVSIADYRKHIEEKHGAKNQSPVRSQCHSGCCAVTRTIEQALSLPYRDFEDVVQMMAAVQCKAEYLVTRNVKDLQPAPLSVMQPSELLALI